MDVKLIMMTMTMTMTMIIVTFAIHWFVQYRIAASHLTDTLGVNFGLPYFLPAFAVTGACKLIDGCSLALCLVTVSVVSAGICHRNKINSIA